MLDISFIKCMVLLLRVVEQIILRWRKTFSRPLTAKKPFPSMSVGVNYAYSTSLLSRIFSPSICTHTCCSSV